MKENDILQFIQWLPTKIKELKDKTPEEIVNTVNQMAQSEEGVATLTQWMQEFKEETQVKDSLFKKGGKLDSLITKYQKGKDIKPLNTVEKQGTDYFIFPNWFQGVEGRKLQSYQPFFGSKIVQRVKNPRGQLTVREISISNGQPQDTTYFRPDGLRFNRQKAGYQGFDPNTGINHPRLSKEERAAKANEYDMIFKKFFK